jgi:hypothetical protein
MGVKQALMDAPLTLFRLRQGCGGQVKTAPIMRARFKAFKILNRKGQTMKTRWMMTAGLIALCGMAQAAFVTIGNAGNTADPITGYGAVGYTYQISKYETTIAEFQAATGAGNGDENGWINAGTNAPAGNVSLYEAMKYCNWLTSGNVNNGLYEDQGGGVWGAKMNRAAVMAGSVNYFALPTEDEWYKAAYYTGNQGDLWSLYANGTDNVPRHGVYADGWNYWDLNNGYAVGDPNYVWTAGYGGAEQNGTYDMMGNVWEWMEDSSGVVRGGSFSDFSSEGALRSVYRDGDNPAAEYSDLGFRVVAIPEPASAMLVFFGAGVGVVIHRLRRSAMRR